MKNLIVLVGLFFIARAYGPAPLYAQLRPWSPPSPVAIASTKLTRGLAIPLPLPQYRAVGRELSLLGESGGRALWIGRPDSLYRWNKETATLDRVLPDVGVDGIVETGGMIWVIGEARSATEGSDVLLLGIASDTRRIVVKQFVVNIRLGRTNRSTIAADEIECCVFLTITTENDLMDAFVYDKRKASLSRTPYRIHHVFGDRNRPVVVKGPLASERYYLSEAARRVALERVAICRSAPTPEAAPKDCSPTSVQFYQTSSRLRSLQRLENRFASDGTSIWVLNTRAGRHTARGVTELVELSLDDLSTRATYGLEDFAVSDSSARFRERDWFDGLEAVGRLVLLQRQEGVARFDTATKIVRPLDLPTCMPSVHATRTEAWVWSCYSFTVAAVVSGADGTARYYRFAVPQASHPLFVPTSGKLGWVAASDWRSLFEVDVERAKLHELPWMPWTIGGVQEIASLSEDVYFGGMSSVVQWEPDSSLEFELESGQQGWLQRVTTSFLSVITKRTVLADGVYGMNAEYSRPQARERALVPLPKLPADHFSVQIREANQPRTPTIPISSSVRIPISLQSALVWRNVELEFDLADQFGNRRLVTLNVLVVSNLLVSSIGFYVLFSSLMACVLVAAPYNRFANNFIMNPYLRKWGTLLAIPLLLTLVPPLRRHLLRRYRKTLKEQLSAQVQMYVLPDSVLDVDTVVKSVVDTRRPLLVHGPSGIGKTAWLYFACHRVASGASTAAASDLPVLVHLRDYQAMEPEKVFFEELKARGQFGDAELADEILRQGTVLFFVDGLNEVDDSIQARWLGFARSYVGTHRFIFTSQSQHAGSIEHLEIRVPELSDDAVRQLAAERAPDAVAKLDGLSLRARALIRNPANLLVVIRLLEEGRAVPETEYELYGAVITPLKQKWVQAGVPSYLEQLRTTAASFAESSHSDVVAARQFPDEVELLRARVVVRKQGRLFFVSDRIAGFLVAESLVEDATILDRMKPALTGQWKLIMDMASQKIDIAGAETVIGALLKARLLSGIGLAEHFVASLESNERTDFGEAWFEKVLLRLARARQGSIRR